MSEKHEAGELKSLFAELRRRNVFRVAGVYLVAAWLLAQVSALLEGSLGLPAWFDALVIALLAIGFPLAVLFAWMYELTPEGLKTTAEIPEGASINSKTGRRLDVAILVGVVLAAGLVIVDRLMPEAPASFETHAARAPQDEADKEEASARGAEAVTKDAPRAEAPAASIAVLPFADMSPGKDQEYFSDGMAEEILNVLARIDGLIVASRTSAFAFRDTAEKASEIAATLNVAYLLEGSVRRDGEKLRITAQLIDAARDRHLWSETYDREMADVFAIQEEIATAIGEALRAKIGGAAVATSAPARTDNLAAYDKYLKARNLLKKRGEGLRDAISLFKEVVAADPGYGPAWSGLAQASEPVIFYLPEAQDPFVLAEYQGLEALAARMAVDRDPSSAEALGGMADHLRDQLQWAAAEDYYRRALAVDANDVEVIEDFQEFLHRVGRNEEALKEARRGQAIEPLWPLLNDWESIHLYQLGQRKRAESLSAAVIAQSPDYASAYNTSFAFALADQRYRDAAGMADATPQGRVVTKEAMRRLLDWAENGRSAQAAPELPSINLVDWFAMLAAAGADDRLFEILGAGDPRINSMALMRVAAHERLRCDPRLKRELIRAELPGYWRAHGWPTFFRAKGADDFECVR